MALQFEFDFTEVEEDANFIEPATVEPKKETDDYASPASKPLTRRNLCRSVLAWLVQNDAAALALQVPTRITKFKADAAAVWCAPVRNTAPVGPRQILEPTRTVVVECRLTREECWPDCANSDELSPLLKQLHERRKHLRAEIRYKEPHLRRGDSLFDEFAEWNYDDTSNMEYHQLRGRIRKLETALYKGTRFEGIRKSRIADFAYLAVPEGLVHPHELAEGWGLIWVSDKMEVTVKVEPEDLDCLIENRLHLAQNIALASRDSVLFANGIRVKDDESEFMPIPRRRRKPTDPMED